MTIARYYQEELHYLRELGRELAARQPEAAPFLAEPMADPAVERLLEGFAFLTGRLREKIDDEIPELTTALLDSLFPHYLRPVPSLTILQFRPSPKALGEVSRVPRGAVVESAPVDGTRCRFATTADLEVVPVQVTAVRLRRGREAAIRVELEPLGGGAFGTFRQDRLRLRITGDDPLARAVFLCFGAYLRRTDVVVADKAGERRHRLPGRGASLSGMRPDEQVLAEDGTGLGCNLMQEYFSFPDRFLELEVAGLGGCRLLDARGAFALEFLLDSMPDNLPDIDERHLLPNCVPAVNLFPHPADPIRIGGERSSHSLTPSGGRRTHYQIHAVTSVSALGGGAGGQRSYLPMDRYDRRGLDDACFYAVSRRPAVTGDALDHEIALQHGSGVPDQAVGSTLSVELRCSNGRLPESLDIGDLSRPLSGIPPELRLRNIVKPTPPIPPPEPGDTLWRLLGLLRMNAASLASAEALRSLVNLFNFRGQHQRHARQAAQRIQDAIIAVRATPERSLHQGVLIAGTGVRIELDEEGFPSTGELFLFASVVAELLAECATLNGFVRVEVACVRSGEVFHWPARLGRRWVV